MTLFGFKAEQKNGSSQFGIVKYEYNHTGDVLKDVVNVISDNLCEFGFDGVITIIPIEDLVKEQYNGFCYLTNTM